MNYIFKLDMKLYEILSRISFSTKGENIFFRYFAEEKVNLFFKLVTKLGECIPELILLIILTFFYFFKRKKIIKKYIQGIAVTLTINSILVEILKISFGRVRPSFLPNPQKFYGGLYLFKNNLLFNHYYLSFPSGHTITIWGTVWFFFFIKSKFKNLLFLLGFLVALSRIYLGYHWFSDTFISIILSYYVAKFVHKLIFKLR